MKVELEIHSPGELRAFSAFANALADTRLGLDKVAVVGKVPQPPIPDEELRDAGGMTQLDRIVEGAAAQTASEANASAAAAPARERGKPSPGHARRTKAEIAEDDAAAAAAPASEPVAAISTGEERIGPEDDETTAAADAADEAAETAASKTDGKLTLEDVRNGMGVYVQKFGMEAIQVDGQEVFKRILGECTLKDDKGAARGWKVSDLPDDQAVLKRIVDGFAELTTKNPFNRSAKAA